MLFSLVTIQNWKKGQLMQRRNGLPTCWRLHWQTRTSRLIHTSPCQFWGSCFFTVSSSWIKLTRLYQRLVVFCSDIWPELGLCYGLTFISRNDVLLSWLMELFLAVWQGASKFICWCACCFARWLIQVLDKIIHSQNRYQYICHNLIFSDFGTMKTFEIEILLTFMRQVRCMCNYFVHWKKLCCGSVLL